MAQVRSSLKSDGPKLNIYDEISSNRWRTVLIFFMFFVMIALLGLGFGAYLGDIAAGTIMILMIGAIYCPIAYFAGGSMILGVSGAREATKQEFPHLVNTVEGLAIASGIPTPKIYVIDDSAINAFATGRDPKNASITVTTGALERLKRVELEGVVAHEMSHIKNYDIRVMMLSAVMVGVIALLSDLFLRSVIYGKSSNDDRGGTNPFFIFAGIAMAILSPFIAQMIQLAVSRKREFLADASGAMITRYPDGLAQALCRIRDDKEPLVEAANKATAHLYIENPLRNHKGFIASMFSTHPDINERIKRLESM